MRGNEPCTSCLCEYRSTYLNHSSYADNLRIPVEYLPCRLILSMIDPSQGADSEAQKMARSMIALPVSETDSNHPTYSCLPHPDLTTPLLRYEQTRRDRPSVNLQSNSVQFVLSSSNIVFACPRECCSELWVVGLFHAKITRAVRRRAIYAGTFRTRLLL